MAVRRRTRTPGTRSATYTRMKSTRDRCRRFAGWRRGMTMAVSRPSFQHQSRIGMVATTASSRSRDPDDTARGNPDRVHRSRVVTNVARLCPHQLSLARSGDAITSALGTRRALFVETGQVCRACQAYRQFVAGQVSDSGPAARSANMCLRSHAPARQVRRMGCDGPGDQCLAR